MTLKELDKIIKKVKDYPKKGILFYDITSILTNSEAFCFCIEELKKKLLKMNSTALVGIEARGFLFSAPLAKELNIPLVLARKKGKLPREVVEKKYDLEYGEDSICIHKSDLNPNEKYVIVDDLIATGGTLKATADLLEENNCTVNGFLSVFGLSSLNYQEKLKPKKVEILINYQ